MHRWPILPSNKMENLLRIVVRSFGLPQAAIYICQDSLVHGVGGEEVGLLLPVTTRELKKSRCLLGSYVSATQRSYQSV